MFINIKNPHHIRSDNEIISILKKHSTCKCVSSFRTFAQVNRFCTIDIVLKQPPPPPPAHHHHRHHRRRPHRQATMSDLFFVSMFCHRFYFPWMPPEWGSRRVWVGGWTWNWILSQTARVWAPFFHYIPCGACPPAQLQGDIPIISLFIVASHFRWFAETNTHPHNQSNCLCQQIR